MRETGNETKLEYLKRIYTDPSHPASFGGRQRLKREADREGKFHISNKEIVEFLESQDTYSTTRRVHRRFKRNRIRVSGIHMQYDMDLCDMMKMRRFRYNKGTRYLLTVIDVFSRYAFVRPLRSKTGQAVASALEDILTSGPKPARCRSDRGMEFRCKPVTDLLMRLGIKQYFSASALKCQPVERFNQTLKGAIYKWCYENRSFSYVPVLEMLVHSYNHRVHSSLFGLSPSEVSESNQARLWNLMYVENASSSKSGERRKVRLFKYSVGDLVRVSLAKRTFERSYNQKFTSQIYRIRGRVYRDNLPVYYLMDLEEKPIESTYYEAELQRVRKNLDNIQEWEIEKILKTKKSGKGQLVLVRYRGLGPSFDRWILKSSISSNRK
ncbi:uncharacterized protein LOC132717880 [Ruditapes philippinarum]|jgi:transposase InsO family protein|uniref:uncharacterized protein LOC132717880 n=1 Tax=Ruditapes philippinarum TaxID=129788 RepID=UPI00295B78C1|nr:uncharacterized protein LOC132717880 [Ruditapes philippinarum]